MKTTMKMMDAAAEYIKQSGKKYQIEKSASVWLSMEVSRANPGLTWQAQAALCQATIDKVSTLL